MNARYRPYNPGEGYFTLIDPGDIKNHNPLLKAIDSFVEDHISIKPFSQSARNEIEGAPAVHPRMMLKVIFYSYAQGVYSSREMEDRMRWDPNYIYLSANQRVDHSTICNFVLKYGIEIKAVFSRLVYVMAKIGYVTMDFVAIDGTKIKADAGMKFTGNVREFRQKQNRIEKKIEKIVHHTTNEAVEGKAHREKKLDALERDKAKIESFLTEVEQEETPPRGKVNLTDRDCRMEMDGDIKRLIYPGGQVIETMVAKEDRGNYFYRFRPDARLCKDCSLRARCYQNKSTYRDFRVKKEYFETLALRARMTEKLSREHGKQRQS